MASDPERQTRSRETFLTIFFAGLATGGFLLFMILVTGGFFFYVLLVGGAIAAFGGLHYFLWGRSLHEHTAGEREEAEFRARLEAEPWSASDSRRPRHY
jgi:hypothetical protein